MATVPAVPPLAERPLVALRAPEPTDLDFLYALENDPAVWAVSDTLAPISRHALHQYLEHAQADFFEVRQQRLIINSYDGGQSVGVLDLFNFEPLHQRAAVGIIILATARRRGYAEQALAWLLAYARNVLHLHQLYCTVAQSNRASIKLFKKVGFRQVGVRHQWLRVAAPARWENAVELQCLL